MFRFVLPLCQVFAFRLKVLEQHNSKSKIKQFKCQISLLSIQKKRTRNTTNKVFFCFVFATSRQLTSDTCCLRIWDQQRYLIRPPRGASGLVGLKFRSPTCHSCYQLQNCLFLPRVLVKDVWKQFRKFLFPTEDSQNVPKPQRRRVRKSI